MDPTRELAEVRRLHDLCRQANAVHLEQVEALTLQVSSLTAERDRLEAELTAERQRLQNLAKALQLRLDEGQPTSTTWRRPLIGVLVVVALIVEAVVIWVARDWRPVLIAALVQTALTLLTVPVMTKVVAGLLFLSLRRPLQVLWLKIQQLLRVGGASRSKS